MRFLIGSFALIFLTAPSVVAQDPRPDLSGEWWNERCSHMDLTISGENVSGNYWTGVGSGIGDAFDLVGFNSGDMLAFSVNFGTEGSLTSWSGQHTVVRGVEMIPTLWHLAANLSPDAGEEETLWRSIWSGANTYVRNKPAHC